MSIENPEQLIGREEYYIPKNLGIKGRVLMKKAVQLIPDERTAGLLESKLSNNSAVIAENLFGSERPASAYFTYNPNEQKLIIEWGKIDPSGDAKLHRFLNQHIDFEGRKQRGWIARSGHIGIINSSLHGQFRIALIDSLYKDQPLTPEKSELSIVKGLISGGIIAVSSDGFPIVLK